jgi:hypothetical protein
MCGNKKNKEKTTQWPLPTLIYEKELLDKHNRLTNSLTAWGTHFYALCGLLAGSRGAQEALARGTHVSQDPDACESLTVGLMHT